jgi:SNARE associated Golgi protein
VIVQYDAHIGTVSLQHLIKVRKTPTGNTYNLKFSYCTSLFFFCTDGRFNVYVFHVHLSIFYAHQPNSNRTTALAVNGFKVLVLMRLSPVPNHVLDYVSGITSIRIVQYIAASIGIIPSTVAFCYAGATASSISEGEENLRTKNHTINTLILVVGLLFGISGIALTSYYAKRELDEMIPSDNDRIENQISDDNIVSNNISSNDPLSTNSSTNQQLHYLAPTNNIQYVLPTQQEIV